MSTHGSPLVAVTAAGMHTAIVSATFRGLEIPAVVIEAAVAKKSVEPYELAAVSEAFPNADFEENSEHDGEAYPIHVNVISCRRPPRQLEIVVVPG